jgi:hypothetical protein
VKRTQGTRGWVREWPSPPCPLSQQLGEGGPGKGTGCRPPSRGIGRGAGGEGRPRVRDLSKGGRSLPSLAFFVSLVSWWSLPLPVHAELVYTSDGQTLYGRVRAGQERGTLVVDGDDDTPTTLRQEEVSAIDFGPAARPATSTHEAGAASTVVLRNGDQLRGTLRQLWPPTVAREEGVIVVPHAWVASVRVKGKQQETGRPERPGGIKDAVELANGDRLEGHIEGVRNGRLRVRASVGALSVDPGRVRSVVMARGDAPIEAAPGIQASVEMADGERITGEWRALSATELRLKPAWATELVLPVQRLVRLTVLNGRLVFLSDLRPTEVQERSYFDTPRPFRTDESQGGRPLRLGGRIYSRGLGVHARSVLTYALAGSYKSFAATVGIDSEVGNGGSVIFRLVGDDRVLHETPVVRGGDAPLPISVDVSGVLLLRLEVHEAEDADIADHADWAEARLLK